MLTGWNNGWLEVRTPTVRIRNVGKETAEWISLTVMTDEHLADLNPKKNGHKWLVRFREHSHHKPEEKATSLKTREQKVKGQRLTVLSNTTLGPRAHVHQQQDARQQCLLWQRFIRESLQPRSGSSLIYKVVTDSRTRLKHLTSTPSQWKALFLLPTS